MIDAPRILLVDDDENYLLVAQRALRRAGVPAAIETARDGAEVFHHLGLNGDNGGEHPSLDHLAVILLDLNMPVLDGWEVLRRLRADRRTQRIPIVIISTSDRPQDVQKSYELGANSFVVKRFESKDPGGYLAETARYWVELNRPPHGGE
ncbi:MAG TPA: response regulator [Candidatus Eisenbacteria bacterium]|nr:response regulator [Candidatus Eisenbacteria bacterium]